MPKFTGKEIVEVLEYVRRQMVWKYQKSGFSYGICICLPKTDCGLWLRRQIMKSLNDSVYVTSWVCNKMKRVKPLSELEAHNYRLAWIDHMIRFYSQF